MFLSRNETGSYRVARWRVAAGRPRARPCAPRSPRGGHGTTHRARPRCKLARDSRPTRPAPSLGPPAATRARSAGQPRPQSSPARRKNDAALRRPHVTHRRPCPPPRCARCVCAPPPPRPTTTASRIESIKHSIHSEYVSSESASHAPCPSLRPPLPPLTSAAPPPHIDASAHCERPGRRTRGGGGGGGGRAPSQPCGVVVCARASWRQPTTTGPVPPVPLLAAAAARPRARVRAYRV